MPQRFELASTTELPSSFPTRPKAACSMLITALECGKWAFEFSSADFQSGVTIE